jgi:hypothetical protein
MRFPNLDLPLRFRLSSVHSLLLVVTATVFLCFILGDWPAGSLAVADVRIDSVGIQSRGDGPARCQRMRKNIIFVLKRDSFALRLGCQARHYENVRKQGDSQSEACHMSMR